MIFHYPFLIVVGAAYLWIMLLILMRYYPAIYMRMKTALYLAIIFPTLELMLPALMFFPIIEKFFQNNPSVYVILWLSHTGFMFCSYAVLWISAFRNTKRNLPFLNPFHCFLLSLCILLLIDLVHLPVFLFLGAPLSFLLFIILNIMGYVIGNRKARFLLPIPLFSLFIIFVTYFVVFEGINPVVLFERILGIYYEPYTISERLSISPDGEKFALSLVNPTGLFIFSLNQTPRMISLADIFENEGYQASGVSFSPDGHHILFQMRPFQISAREKKTVKETTPTEQPSELYLYSFQDGTLRRLTDTDRWEYGASFSSDGTEIFFFRGYKASRRKGDSRFNIYKMRIDGSNEKRLIAPGLIRVKPTSPISIRQYSSMLLFSGIAMDGKSEEIYSVYLNNGGIIKRIIKADTTGGVNSRLPIFSPDGRKVLYVRDEVDRSKPHTEVSITSEIWMMDVDGSNQIQLTNSKFLKKSPIFSVDGKKIYFLAVPLKGRDEYELWVMGVDGKNPHRLAKLQPPQGSHENAGENA